MAVWNTTAYLFVIIAGSIFGFLLLIGIIGIIIKYMRERKLERDLEANQAQPKSNHLPQVEMVAVEPKPSNGPDEIRRNTIADPTFDPVEYVEIEDPREVESEVKSFGVKCIVSAVSERCFGVPSSWSPAKR
ncbi:MAG: hypothetical protein LQ341_003208 [Variospora aurantia]|nr:MAG: hypothetical protein LQ341_003208 [Variospora aurantia]